MARLFSKSIFLFRRDLRLDDNTGLLSALAQSELVAPCFILDPRQIEKHRYRSLPALAFMLESLADLDTQLRQKKARLNIFHGEPSTIVGKLIQREKIQAVFVNRDYTPYSKKRDQRLKILCRALNVQFLSYDDVLLNPPKDAVKADKSPYLVFTPYYRKMSCHEIHEPKANRAKNYLGIKTSLSYSAAKKLAPQIKEQPQREKGGRTNAKRRLSNIKHLSNYSDTHDIPAITGTTRLSAHLKFGTCSIREAYWSIKRQFGDSHPLIRQLFWRDFFTHIAWHFPKVFGQSFREMYEKIHWQNNPKWLELWKNGETGFPIVDAGMRELTQTGFMHNRVRMITASFLVKDLLIDWRKGEQHFATRLVDYDPAVNNGNWQWSASTGCDAQPFFRIFNPWIQQKKFDPDCLYIKRWIPELRDLPPKKIHTWFSCHARQNISYPKPIVDHDEQRAYALRLFTL